MIVTKISNSFDSSCSYIYIWVSKNLQCIYVGQTSGNGGVVSRSSGHVRKKGTLRTRVYERCGMQIESANDWNVLSFVLPKKKIFTGVASSHREAIEYLVQTKLNEIRADTKPPFEIVSNVNYSDYCDHHEINILANNIIKKFINFYKS